MPMGTRLFFILRDKICMQRWISSSRPMTGSNFPCFAISGQSIPYFSRASYFPSESATTASKEVLLAPQKRKPYTMWLQSKSKKENPNKMWLQSQKQMGESGSMWTPYHRRVTGWDQTHHRWRGECEAKPPPTGDRTHHLQCIEWESSVASPETGTPSRSFPLAASLPLALVGGSQGRGGGSSQSRITESKICGQTPVILLVSR
jgi:hypothetical protein